MATRHLTALDYSDYHASNILKKHAKNRPLGDIECRHNYVPAQPVLSCRTVEIDLPGTRTYRPKSTVDILEEQQRMIRQLYSKQRTAASAPPRHRTDPSARATPDNFQRINIEVRGRPLTSSSQVSYGNIIDSRSNVGQKRPKTTGRLKNIQPATDCFMVVKFDQDLAESSKNKRLATNHIHNYWRSENHNLAVGKFVRGQNRPDDVPPTLDAWLTFGGAAEDENEGLIDAFATFKNSEEYYNIEGSVGSKVAKQLQKGDKIRIGINGVLQSRDLKVKKWNKENANGDEDEGQKEESQEEITEEEREEEEEEAKFEQENGISDQIIEADQTEDQYLPDDDDCDIDGGFAELQIDQALLDDLSADVVEVEKDMSSRKTPVPVSVPVKRAESPPREIVPLSWNDQCSKPDVKVINARVNLFKEKKQVMSETHPVKFEKLCSSGIRPKLSQPREANFKVKQRLTSLKDKENGRSTPSKVKSVYIDPLSKEEEEKLNSLSIEEIINDKVDSRYRRENGAKPVQGSLRNDPGMITVIEKADGLPSSQKANSSRHNQSRNRPSSNCSAASDRSNGIPSPKLKTQLVNSSHNPNMVGNLSIMTPGARYTSPINEMPRSSKTPGRISSTKSLHRAGTISSIKSGPLQGETEYIKITSQLKVAPNGNPLSPSSAQQMSHIHYDYRPGSNTPQDGTRSPFAELMTYEDKELYNKDTLPVLKSGSEHGLDNDQDLIQNSNDDNNDINNNDDSNASILSESPAPTIVAISIPTADELSDRDSLTNSPSRPGAGNDDNLTSYQIREKTMRNEQIDQLTDLLGNAVVN